MELLVIISIITMLLSILSPSLSQARKNARMAVCMSQLHQFAVAWTTYTDDSGGTLMGASTGRPKYDWVVTLDGPSLPTNENVDNLKAGVMWPYVRNPELYRCPDEYRLNYARTYSMSNRLGGLSGWGIETVSKQHHVQKQDRLLLMMEEPDPRGYNWGSWVINPKNSGAPHNWIDWAGNFHNKGSTLSFADTHAEYWGYQDPRTAQVSNFNAFTPGNPDLVRFQEAYTP